MQKPAAHQKTNFTVLSFFYNAFVYIGKLIFFNMPRITLLLSYRFF
jgi:hypothetical protein